MTWSIGRHGGRSVQSEVLSNKVTVVFCGKEHSLTGSTQKSAFSTLAEEGRRNGDTGTSN